MIAHQANKPDKLMNCKMLIMTSLENHKETKEFFERNKFFGGEQKNFVFF
jgi:UDP-N-acetylglucosamine pyrophosphorylase